MKKDKVAKSGRMEYASFFSRGEELLNAWSHAAGIVLAVVAGAYFLYICLTYESNPEGELSAGGMPVENSFATFGITLYLIGMLGSYLTSTLYHALPNSRAKAVLRRWDHAAIYWHIAGSYSPITLLALRGRGYWGWGLFAFVWTSAIVGTWMSFRRLSEHSYFETICFCLMGLSVLVAFGPLLSVSPADAIAWIIAEGVCYITGAVFYSLRRRFMHAVFHFFVLAGSLCHIIAVRSILLAQL